MLSELRYWHDDEESVPEGESPDVWQYRKSIQEKCRLPCWPPHILTPEIADNIQFVRHQILVRLPEEFSRDDALSFFLTREHPFGGYYKVGRYGDIEYDMDKADAAFASSRYMPHHWDVEMPDLLASYERSLNEDSNIRPGYVEFPTHDRVKVQLGIRRGKKPDPQTLVEGLYYRQYIADEWHWEPAAPQLFAAIEKNLEKRSTTDPFQWVQERALIASAYSVLGGGKECSPVFLAEVYEGMASTMCNTTPTRHQEPIEYEVGEVEQSLLIELYGRYAGSVSPEMVVIVLEYAQALTPEIIRDNTTIRSFLDHLPEMLENGLNISRILQCTDMSSRATSVTLENLESAMKISLGIYCGQKPWWFKEDFDLNEFLLEDEDEDSPDCVNIRNNQAGRAVLERISVKAGFAFQHVVPVYDTHGHRMALIAPFQEDDAIDFTVFVTQRYGIGNLVRCREVLQYCFRILQQEEESCRWERLKQLREHLDEVRPQTVTFGCLEAGNPVFEMPGVNHLAATMLGRDVAESGEVHDQRIGFDKLQAIGELFTQPLGLRARKYAPALPSYLANLERRGLLVS
jgi:hypothetical protein